MLIVRRTYPELINNHINVLRVELLGVAKYNDKDKVLKFVNGSTINFTYCDNNKDLDRLQGVEYDAIFLDEATQLSEYQMKTITACLRGVNDFPKRVYYTCNPGGQGHGYIKRIFIDKRYEEGENPEDYTFIQSLVTDNRVLMESQPDYIKQLEALPKQLREAWLYGRWDVFAGQVFEEFVNDERHYHDRYNTHVIQPFLIPREWRVLCAMDWGYTRPFSIGWYTFDREGRMYRINEFYGCDSTPNVGMRIEPSEVARMMKEIEQRDPNLRDKRITYIGDPAIWGKQGGKSIGELFEDERISFDKAKHDRLNGKMQCHNRLAFDADGVPMFYTFSTCKHFIRTVPNLVYDDVKVEDVDTDGEDHIYDEWRYACMEYPIEPREQVKQRLITYDPLSMDDIKYDQYNWYRLN